MSDRPDAPTLAALGQPYVRPRFFAWLDIVGDPVRVTTSATPVTFSGTGDPDLDGFTFDALDPEFVSVSPVKSGPGGGDTVTATLSGLIGPNSDLLNLLGNRANWRLRTARLWWRVVDPATGLEGGIVSYFTGQMLRMPIRGDGEEQTISLEIETYLASISRASNRTYLDQAQFDPADRSAEVAIPVANGVSGAGIAAVPSFGLYGGGGRSYLDIAGIKLL
jgi:hypothetical protein